MQNITIQIVDQGRGPQLSTSRVTVMDLVPYFQEGCSYEEIIRWIPTLSPEEIKVADAYYRSHQAELDKQDQLIRERSLHRTNPEWVEKIAAEARAERMARLNQLAKDKCNGEAR